MNKKHRILTMGLLLLLFSILAGCGSQDGTPVQPPEAEEVELTGTPYDYDLAEYVTLRDYEGISYVPYGDPDRTTAEYGDAVTVEMEAQVEGVEEPVTGVDSFVVGHSGFLAGFDQGLVGHGVDEEIRMDLVFPEEYPDEIYAGKPVEVTARILILDRTADREINEDALWQIVLDESEVLQYPQAELEQYTADFRENYVAFARQYDMELDEYLRSFFRSSEDELEELCRQDAEALIKEELVMFAIFRDADLTLTQEDLDNCKPLWLRTYGYEHEEDLTAGWEDPGVAASLEKMAIRSLVKTHILTTAVPAEKPAE